MDLVQFFLLIWPPYVANGSAVFAGRLRRRHPLDFGRRFRDGRRIFGDGKTFEGLAIGTAAGTLLGYAPNLIRPYLSLLDAFGCLSPRSSAILLAPLLNAVSACLGVTRRFLLTS